MAFSFLSVLPLAMQQVQGLLLVCSQVTIITSGALVTEDSSVASLHHQQVALLATANGTHIAVQVGRGMEGVGSRPEGEVRGGTVRESSGPLCVYRETGESFTLWVTEAAPVLHALSLSLHLGNREASQRSFLASYPCEPAGV